MILGKAYYIYKYKYWIFWVIFVKNKILKYTQTLLLSFYREKVTDINKNAVVQDMSDQEILDFYNLATSTLLTSLEVSY